VRGRPGRQGAPAVGASTGGRVPRRRHGSTWASGHGVRPGRSGASPLPTPGASRGRSGKAAFAQGLFVQPAPRRGLPPATSAARQRSSCPCGTPGFWVAPPVCPADAPARPGGWVRRPDAPWRRRPSRSRCGSRRRPVTPPSRRCRCLRGGPAPRDGAGGRPVSAGEASVGRRDSGIVSVRGRCGPVVPGVGRRTGRRRLSVAGVKVELPAGGRPTAGCARPSRRPAPTRPVSCWST
jgi:hypothetical protein